MRGEPLTSIIDDDTSVPEYPLLAEGECRERRALPYLGEAGRFSRPRESYPELTVSAGRDVSAVHRDRWTQRPMPARNSGFEFPTVA